MISQCKRRELLKEFSLKNIIQSFPDPIAILDGGGSLRFVNNRFLQTTGFSYFELMTNEALSFFKPRMSVESYNKFYQFFKEDSEVDHALDIPRLKLKLASGKGKYFQLKANKVHFEDHVFLIIQLRDLKHKVLLERKELEHLETLNQALFQLSHGVRHPVSLCLGLIELLESPGELDVDEMRTYLEYFKKAVGDIDREIREMNEFLDKNRKLVQKIKI